MAMPWAVAVASGTLLPRCSLALVSLVLMLVAVPLARAQTASPNQPEAIRSRGLSPAPCPLLVPRQEAVLQPLRLHPSQVPLKNALGCLSPADAAVYGADGCPLKLCGASSGALNLELGPPPRNNRGGTSQQGETQPPLP